MLGRFLISNMFQPYLLPHRLIVLPSNPALMFHNVISKDITALSFAGEFYQNCRLSGAGRPGSRGVFEYRLPLPWTDSLLDQGVPIPV
jgi:hypothetical protein